MRFIERHIHSVLQLEVLLLLRAHAGGWSATKVADELRITPQSAELRLRDLHLRKLASHDRSTDTYSYEPTTRARQLLVDDLAECYVTMRYTVINLIFSVPCDSARTLANAFRFRRRVDDD